MCDLIKVGVYEIKAGDSCASTSSTESRLCWVRSCLLVASITGKPRSQTAQLTDLASAPTRRYRLGPWDKARLHRTCTVLGHRGKPEHRLPLLVRGSQVDTQAESLRHPTTRILLSCPGLSQSRKKTKASNIPRLNCHCDY